MGRINREAEASQSVGAPGELHPAERSQRTKPSANESPNHAAGKRHGGGYTPPHSNGRRPKAHGGGDSTDPGPRPPWRFESKGVYNEGDQGGRHATGQSGFASSPNVSSLWLVD